jgi:hypothetical protein
MNSIIDEYYPTFRLYQRLRDQLMESLSDADLSFTPGGANPPLGALCKEIGEIEQAYVDSFRTFSLHFNDRMDDPEMLRSTARLKSWYAELDERLHAAVAGLSEEDVAGRAIDRGHDFKVPPLINLDIYKEALLIFYGKTTVYLKAMGKQPSQQWSDWIA